MIRSTTVQYESLEFDAKYVLDEGCKGDWYTPPKEASVTITEVLIDDINILDIKDDISDAIEQMNSVINSEDNNIFMGSSLGGYYATHFANKYNAKSIMINPAIHPLENFEVYLGENENYDTGNKFNITKDDIKLLRSLAPKKIKNPHKILVLLESGDEILDYKMTISYFRGANIDIFLGGDHSYSSFELKLEKIKKFINS